MRKKERKIERESEGEKERMREGEMLHTYIMFDTRSVAMS